MPKTERKQEHQQQKQQQQQLKQQQQQQEQQQEEQQPLLLQTSRSDEDDERIEEIEPVPYRTIYDKVYEMAEQFSGTRIGQFVIERGDRALRTVEETAKWSLPQDKNPDGKLERPLSWMPFLMMIISLRLVRTWLSVGSLLIGNRPVTAHDVVYFIQTRRRKLRSMRVHGMKEIQRREMEKSNANKNAGGLMKKFQILLSSAICRPGQHYEPVKRVFIHKGVAIICDDREKTNERNATKRSRDKDDDDEESDLNLTVDQMLTKYADASSDDDSDFIPPPEKTSTDDEDGKEDGTSTGTDESCDDEATEESKKETTPESDSIKEKPKNEQGDNTKDSNNSVEIKTNGDRNTDQVPQPMLEPKKEPLSDTESGGNEQVINGPSNGADNREVDVAAEKFNLKRCNAVLSENYDETIAADLKNLAAASTSDESTIKSEASFLASAAAVMKAQRNMRSTLDTTAVAGSPPDFNAMLQRGDWKQKPVPIKPQVQERKVTPLQPKTSEYSQQHSSDSSYEGASNYGYGYGQQQQQYGMNYRQHSQQNQQQNSQYSNANRNRNRNRR